MATQSAQEGACDPPPRAEKPVKPARFISKFRTFVKHEAEKNKSKWKTMGPAKVAVPSPNDFLQKHSKEPKLAPRKKEQDGKKEPALSVPGRTYRPVIRIKKNFININALAVIKGVPKKPRHFCVDSRQGDKYLLEPSGLVPKYIKKKALKKKWEELNREFQCLPVLTDTRYKKMHKAEVEMKLKQLEHDIEALEKHKWIYIANE
ncbi:enkurin isoform X2 [Myiozetetes cayanensis]|uniref:enkurin isoform X2 n=1 Tax=Myiozetetes cayanensis TaxID=478635 RepID=UPI00215E4BC8|nr:enkurin isoform X2 [Myiozetetes cayanensis]